MTLASMTDMFAPELDRWLPDPQIRTHYSRSASASAAALWPAAETVRVRDAPRLGRVLRWRIPGTPADIPYREVFRRYPFTVLEEDEGWSVSGLAGKPWSLRRDYPQLSGADEFCDWDEPGTVRILFAHWVAEADGDGAAIVSESRVEPVDRSARWRMRALWSAVGRFEGLIGREALDAAVRAAER
jgi:hypothetical protein